MARLTRNPIETALIGQIAAEFYERLKIAQNTSTQSLSGIRETAWELLDEKYGERPDFQLLRHAFRFTEAIPTAFGTVADAAERGKSNSSQEIVWGTLALLPAIATSGRHALTSEDAVRLLSWDSLNVAPLRNAPINCALVRLLFRAARDKVNQKHGSAPALLAEADDLVNMTEETLTKAAFGWRPGRAIIFDTRKLGYERKLFPGSLADLQRRVATAIFAIRAAVRDTCKVVPWSESVDALLRRVAPLIFSVWRTWRTVRESPPPHITGEKLIQLQVKTLRNELKALERACQAARDAGEYTTAAKLAATLLFLVPEGAEDEYLETATRVANTIREHGYTVDRRFIGQAAELELEERQEELSLDEF